MPSSNVLLPSVSICTRRWSRTTAPMPALSSAHLELLSLQCPGSIAIGDMHLLLFEGAAHLSSQFIENLPPAAIIKMAGVLPADLTSTNAHRLTMPTPLPSHTAQ